MFVPKGALSFLATENNPYHVESPATDEQLWNWGRGMTAGARRRSVPKGS
jgi:hypothetical protein